MEKEYTRFGDLLHDMIQTANMTHVDFYTKLGIKKPYFYDILKGTTNPPPPEKQFKIIEILDPKDKDRIINFFELAAKERREVPADIAAYLHDKSIRTKIRTEPEYKKLIRSTISKKITGEIK